MIVEKLITSLESELSRLTVKKVVVGLRYTCAVLSDDSCGLAATLDEGRCCSKFNWSGPLAGRPALDLARGLMTADSPDFISQPLFLAALLPKNPLVMGFLGSRSLF